MAGNTLLAGFQFIPAGIQISACGFDVGHTQADLID
jgi:hypothetical protein